MTPRQSLKTVVLLLAFLIAALPSCRPKNRKFSGHELAVLEASEAVIRLFSQNPGAVWPGYDLSRQPFIVYIPEKWALLLNAPEGKVIEGFSTLPPGWPDLGTPALYHVGRYKDLIGQLAFAFPVADFEVAAIGIPEGLMPEETSPNVDLISFIVHENFHEFQDKHFGEIPWQREERYPILDAGNTALAYLEMAILKDALGPVYDRDAARIEEAARRFTAVRRERWNNGPSFVRKYEQGQEIREGTAQYVQMRCADLLKDLDHRSSAGGRRMRGASGEFSPLAIRQMDFETRMKGNTIEPDDMIRNRIYPVGATLGLLADALAVDWKGAAQKAGTDFSFCEILGTALPPDAHGRSGPAIVEEAKRFYGYEAILAATNEAIAAYKQGFRQALETFESQPGIRIEIGFPYRSLSRSRVNAGRKWVINDGAMTLGLRFRAFTLKNDDLAVETRDNGVLENDDWSGKKKRAAFFVSEISSLTVDGAAASLEPSPSRDFKTLELLGPNFSIRVKIPGTIVVSGRAVTVSLIGK